MIIKFLFPQVIVLISVLFEQWTRQGMMSSRTQGEIPFVCLYIPPPARAGSSYQEAGSGHLLDEWMGGMDGRMDGQNFPLSPFGSTALPTSSFSTTAYSRERVLLTS